MNVSLFKAFATCKPTQWSWSLPQHHKPVTLAAVSSQCGCWEKMFYGRLSRAPSPPREGCPWLHRLPPWASSGPEQPEEPGGVCPRTPLHTRLR